jgi:hypothetical protein
MSPRKRRPDPTDELFPDATRKAVDDVSLEPTGRAEQAPQQELRLEPEPAGTVPAPAEPELEPEPAAAEVATPADAPPVSGKPPRDGRLPSLRVASLHLRMGQHALARAQLEAFAGRGLLDEQALLDLAEVRWRSGDLVGATEASAALLTRGHETLLALVIAAEGFAVTGRPTEARRLALRAVELAGAELESVFAGMPSSRIWPDGSLPASTVRDGPDAPDRVAAADELVGLAVPRTPDPELQQAPTPPAEGLDRELEPDLQPADAPPADDDEQVAPEAEADATTKPASTADVAIAAAAAAMRSARIDQASLLFGLALRLDPASAAIVLIEIDAPAADPRLALVEGDALQLLGRDAEARDAFSRASGSLLDGGHNR